MIYSMSFAVESRPAETVSDFGHRLSKMHKSLDVANWYICFLLEEAGWSKHQVQYIVEVQLEPQRVWIQGASL